MSLKNNVSIGNMAEQLSVKFVQLALNDYSVDVTIFDHLIHNKYM